MATTSTTNSSPGDIIKTLAVGTFTTLCKVKPLGALQARRQSTGATAFYWRYSQGTASERVQIGLYDSSAPPRSLTPTAKGYSIAAAVRAAENMSLAHHAHRDKGGRPALLAAERRAKQADADAKRRAAANTLERLLLAYCDYLEGLGRRSHADARSIFKLHVIGAWPKVAAMPASEVTGEQIADMMRRLNEAGKGRTANKLRSYARAAYQTAKAAKSKATIPVAFKDYRVTANPVAETEPDESANKPDKNPLSAKEMHTYWQCIRAVPGWQGAVLRLHLLTGGLRIEQFVNLRTANVQADSITLLDGKGRSGKPVCFRVEQKPGGVRIRWPRGKQGSRPEHRR